MILNLIKEIKNEIKDIKYRKKNVITFSLAISIIITIFLWKFSLLNYWTLPVSIIITSLILPIVIYPLYYVFTIITIIIGKIISSFILIFIFYLLITPIGIIKRTLKPSIEADYNKNKQSYWTKRDKDDYNFKNQF